MKLTEKLSECFRRLHREFSYQNLSPDQKLDISLEVWEDIFDTSDDEKNHIHMIGQRISRQNLIQFVDNVLNRAEGKEGHTTYEATTLVYVAVSLLIVVIGLIFYIKNNNAYKEKKPSHHRSLGPYSSTPNYSLFLVINAERIELIEFLNSLRQQGADLHWEEGISDALVRATKALWIGSESDPVAIKLNSKINKSSDVSDKSEYDVHFVRITLKNYHSGFCEDSDILDRRDAFKNLAINAKSLEISPRLNSASYENVGLYK